jgi:hypothetical protein
MPTKERFRHAPRGAYFQRHPLLRSSQFRFGRQPKLRELVLGYRFVTSFEFLSPREYFLARLVSKLEKDNGGARFVVTLPAV